MSARRPVSINLGASTPLLPDSVGTSSTPGTPTSSKVALPFAQAELLRNNSSATIVRVPSSPLSVATPELQKVLSDPPSPTLGAPPFAVPLTLTPSPAARRLRENRRSLRCGSSSRLATGSVVDAAAVAAKRLRVVAATNTKLMCAEQDEQDEQQGDDAEHGSDDESSDEDSASSSDEDEPDTARAPHHGLVRPSDAGAAVTATAEAADKIRGASAEADAKGAVVKVSADAKGGKLDATASAPATAPQGKHRCTCTHCEKHMWLPKCKLCFHPIAAHIKFVQQQQHTIHRTPQ